MRQFWLSDSFILLLVLISSCGNNCSENITRSNEKEYSLVIISDLCVYNNNNHSAFTCLQQFDNNLFLAFREGSSHRPNFESDYGKIRILKKELGIWISSELLSDKRYDLRDPFLVNVFGKLFLFCGYNIFSSNGYQHGGTLYSIYDSGKWSDFKSIQSDVPHIIWLWKIRKYKNHLYGVGYLEGKRPTLLVSNDGVKWKTVTEFKIDGILSEADLSFQDDSLYVCLRKDTPLGSPSLWGKSSYPFTSFEWKEMNVSVASPELIRLPYSKQMVLSGREYAFNRENYLDSTNVSIFMVDRDANVNRIYTLNTGRVGDKGYPSFELIEDTLLMSCYYGTNANTNIDLVTIFLDKKE